MVVNVRNSHLLHWRLIETAYFTRNIHGTDTHIAPSTWFATKHTVARCREYRGASPQWFRDVTGNFVRVSRTPVDRMNEFAVPRDNMPDWTRARNPLTVPTEASSPPSSAGADRTPLQICRCYSDPAISIVSAWLQQTGSDERRLRTSVQDADYKRAGGVFITTSTEWQITGHLPMKTYLFGHW